MLIALVNKTGRVLSVGRCQRQIIAGNKKKCLALLLILTGCSGGSGSDTQVLPNTNTSGGSGQEVQYNGPAPQTADVQSFKINVWDNLVEDNRCGGCHGAGGQTPQFVRSDDINLAYNAANTIVDLGNPANSQMVTKVAGGHNCWLSSDAACADIIQGYITDWASDSVGGTANVVALTAPPLKEVGNSKTFPVDSSDFANTVYPLLQTYCSGCHSEDAPTPQQPYFAASDVDVAYAAAKSKIDLDSPNNSRLVLRLRNEFHNCWDDCQSNANTMQAAIEAFANNIPLTTVDPQLVLSKALSLFDGVVASSGGRHEANVIAEYQFKAGSGFTAFDTSGVNPALDLTISGDVEWIGGWGIRINNGKAQGSTSASRKIYDLITGTGEYSIEAWVAPANVTQEGPAGIVSYSGGTTLRNFTLGQTLYNYDFFNRNSNADANGSPALSTPDADEVLQATLQHVVATYSPADGRRLYVNGEFIGNADLTGGSSLTNWDDTFAFVLGNEVSGDRLWRGVFRMVAIHNRVLTDQQIRDNFNVGVGEKYFLLFSVSHLISVPDSYIVFEVSQFDNYGYLFNSPFFISLDSSATLENIAVKGMRIGMNGREVTVGQAYRNLDTSITSTNDTGSGQTLSNLGTVIALDKGPEADEFFLTFEQLGSHTHVSLEPIPPVPALPADLPPQSEIGLRTFDEINATMMAVTGVSSVQSDVLATFLTVKQQLPSVENIEGFISAHQMGVTQLAIEYCNALVDDINLRAAYFPGFDFTATPDIAFSTINNRDLIIDPLLARMVGSGLDTQPDDMDIGIELNNLLDTTTTCGSSCPAGHTATVVKAVCSAVLGSAALLVQ